MSIQRSSRIAVAMLGIYLISEVAWAAPRYRAIELTGFQAQTMNDSGEIAGWLPAMPGVTGAIWRDGRYELIDSLGGTSMHPQGINELGVVTGYGSIATPSSGNYPFIWDGQTHPLQPAFSHNTVADAINDLGDIVGRIGGLHGNAFLVQDGMLIDLGTLPGPWESHAYSINNRRQIVGNVYDHGFIWENGTMHDLSLGPRLSSNAYDINELSQIAGSLEFPDGHYSATVLEWQTGNIIELGTLQGTLSSIALAINNHTQVIGWAWLGGFENYVAFYWEDGLMIPLGDLPGLDGQWTFGFAWDINDAGQILADGCSRSGSCEFFLLTPVAPADLDADGAIDTIDLGILLSNWSLPMGSPGCRGSPGPCYADINGDGSVDSVDLGILLSDWTL